MSAMCITEPRRLSQGGVASEGVLDGGPNPRGVSEGGVGPGDGG